MMQRTSPAQLSDHRGLLPSEYRLGWSAVSQSLGRELHNGVELAPHGKEVLKRTACQYSSFRSLWQIWLKKLWETGDVCFGHSNQEAVPVGPWREYIAIGDQDRCHTSGHRFEESDASPSCSARTEREVRRCHDLRIKALPVRPVRLRIVPVVILRSVLNQHVRPVELNVE